MKTAVTASLAATILSLGLCLKISLSPFNNQFSSLDRLIDKNLFVLSVFKFSILMIDLLISHQDKYLE